MIITIIIIVYNMVVRSSTRKHKNIFDNSIAKSLITVCFFERSHPKQLEYIEDLKWLYSLVSHCYNCFK